MRVRHCRSPKYVMYWPTLWAPFQVRRVRRILGETLKLVQPIGACLIVLKLFLISSLVSKFSFEGIFTFGLCNKGYNVWALWLFCKRVLKKCKPSYGKFWVASNAPCIPISLSIKVFSISNLCVKFGSMYLNFLHALCFV